MRRGSRARPRRRRAGARGRSLLGVGWGVEDEGENMMISMYVCAGRRWWLVERGVCLVVWCAWQCGLLDIKLFLCFARGARALPPLVWQRKELVCVCVCVCVCVFHPRRHQRYATCSCPAAHPARAPRAGGPPGQTAPASTGGPRRGRRRDIWRATRRGGRGPTRPATRRSSRAAGGG